MSEILQFNQKALSKKYPPASEHEIPETYELRIVDFKTQEIEKYPVALWHLFLKKYYGPPMETESFLRKAENGRPKYNNGYGRSEEIVSFRRDGEDQTKIRFLNLSTENLKKYQAGELTLDIGFRDWKYFIKLPSKNIIVLETQECHTSLRFGLVNCEEDAGVQEAEKFISDLLNEIQKDAKNLLNPKKMLKDNKAAIYLLWNGYLSNYVSGKQMHNVAKEQEDNLRKEMAKYDTYSLQTSSDAQKHTNDYILRCGMFYSSAISYFFMAFEGFLNLIFYSFIKEDLRDIDFETRFDIKQKMKLMPSLCHGFKNNKIDLPSELENEFNRLRKYRNEVFHSKSGDNRLKSMITYQDGFMYTYEIDDFEDYFLPPHKLKLKAEDVDKVKSIVDGLIEKILDSMGDEIRTLTEKYILQQTIVPFVVKKGGTMVLGAEHAPRFEI